jgi:hypothetical protein
MPDHADLEMVGLFINLLTRLVSGLEHGYQLACVSARNVMGHPMMKPYQAVGQLHGPESLFRKTLLVIVNIRAGKC